MFLTGVKGLVAVIMRAKILKQPEILLQIPHWGNSVLFWPHHRLSIACWELISQAYVFCRRNWYVLHCTDMAQNRHQLHFELVLASFLYLKSSQNQEIHFIKSQ